MKKRILSIIEDHKMAPAQFADEIGVQRSAISHIINERNKPSLDMIQKILARFPDIDAKWLITGNLPESSQIRKSHSLNLFDQEDTNNEESVTYTENSASKFESQIHQTRENTMHSASHSGSAPISARVSEQVVTEVPPLNMEPTSSAPSHLVSSPVMNMSLPQVKKVKRIIVFYDDDTYEELAKN